MEVFDKEDRSTLFWFIGIMIILMVLGSSCNQKVCPAYEKYTPQAERRFQENSRFIANSKCPLPTSIQPDTKKIIKQRKKQMKKRGCY